MTALVLASTVLAAAWGAVALIGLRLRKRPGMLRIAIPALLVAATQAAATVWAPAAALVIGAWVGYAIAVPWALVRGRDTTIDGRRTVHWLAAASVFAMTWALGCVTINLMTGQPGSPAQWAAFGLVVVPVGQVAAILVPGTRAASMALIEAVATAGVVALVAVTYLVIVVGIDGSPHGHERSVLLASLAAAVTVALLALPVRRRAVRAASRLVGAQKPSSSEVVSGFGARMSRAVPMDELMLQLAESLQASIAPGGAEIWTGLDGLLHRTVSVPHRGAAQMTLAEQERVVVGRARIGGPAWTAVWLPFLAGPERVEGDHRAVPVAHLGELLGLIVVRRPPEVPAFTEDDEMALVDLARQLGLALHNVRLDSALQASLAELAQRNEQLQASRLRIVTAADSARRAIERNLHDGAQQHLVALAVKLGLARQIAEDGDVQTVLGLLADLRGDVQTTIGQLRELAHGIYPPLLRDRGLGEALGTAAARSPLPCTVDVDLRGRYDEQVETAAYFCCLEAMQNAGKYAGDGATISVRVRGGEGVLSFELADDGVGFDAAAAVLGHGFLNMTDRLGAIGGTLSVESTPGTGTTVSATIPARPRAAGGVRLPPSAPSANGGGTAESSELAGQRPAATS